MNEGTGIVINREGSGIAEGIGGTISDGIGGAIFSEGWDGITQEGIGIA